MIITLLLMALAQHGGSSAQVAPSAQPTKKLEPPPSREKWLYLRANDIEKIDGKSFKVLVPKELDTRGKKDPHILESWRVNEKSSRRSLTRSRSLAWTTMKEKTGQPEMQQQLLETVCVLYDAGVDETANVTFEKDGSVSVTQVPVVREKIAAEKNDKLFWVESRTADGTPCYRTEYWRWEWGGLYRYKVSITEEYEGKNGAKVRRGRTPESVFSVPLETTSCPSTTEANPPETDLKP